MSPEFRLRPLLSDAGFDWMRGRLESVAGVQAPAFVERSSSKTNGLRMCKCVAGVQAPAFVERRRSRSAIGPTAGVSPEFRLRPLLSDGDWRRGVEGSAGVAGVQAPAFVERASCRPCGIAPPGVAGVQAPAFVERAAAGLLTVSQPAVSPEFRLRPLLSGLRRRRLSLRL